MDLPGGGVGGWGVRVEGRRQGGGGAGGVRGAVAMGCVPGRARGVSSKRCPAAAALLVVGVRARPRAGARGSAGSRPGRPGVCVCVSGGGQAMRVGGGGGGGKRTPGVAHGLAAHDALHVGRPAKLGGDERARRVGEAARDQHLRVRAIRVVCRVLWRGEACCGAGSSLADRQLAAAGSWGVEWACSGHVGPRAKGSARRV
jgi:hypothetical protein